MCEQFKEIIQKLKNQTETLKKEKYLGGEKAKVLFKYNSRENQWTERELKKTSSSQRNKKMNIYINIQKYEANKKFQHMSHQNLRRKEERKWRNIHKSNN